MRYTVPKKQKPPYDDRIGRDRPFDDWRSILIDILNPGAQHSDLRMRFKIPKLLFKSCRQADVIGIHTSNIAALRQPATSIQRSNEPAILLRVYLDAAVPPCIL